VMLHCRSRNIHAVMQLVGLRNGYEGVQPGHECIRHGCISSARLVPLVQESTASASCKSRAERFVYAESKQGNASRATSTSTSGTRQKRLHVTVIRYTGHAFFIYGHSRQRLSVYRYHGEAGVESSLVRMDSRGFALCSSFQ
jgi:hypothetical protein